MAQDSAIIIKDLNKSYGSTDVLKGVSFTVKRGTMLALLGPNGAGKTTTVRIMSTLLGLDSGTVSIEDNDVTKNPDDVRKIIGLTGQSAAVDEMLTGRENLIMMGRLYRLTKKSAKIRAEELLQEFDLMEAANKPLKAYSGGMRRRLDLAISLIATPPIVFLDEPTTGLDPRSRISMWNSITQLKKAGTTIVLTTQYLEEADQLADRIVVIDDGKVIAEGTAKELKSKIGNDRLELTFKSQGTYKKAKEVLAETISDTNEDELTISVMIQDTNRDVQGALQTLSASNITIESMAVRKPTLDDVFLSLTDKKQEAS